MTSLLEAVRVARVAPGRWSLRRVLLALIGIGMLVVLVDPALLAQRDPYELDVPNRFLPPSPEHPFGTDEAGRDILTRVIHGARSSIGSALAVAGLAAAFGTLYGAVSGWLGGWVDRILMRIVDVFLAFPYLVLAMAVAASIGRDLRSAVLALSVVWWPGYARMIRGQVLSLKQQLYVRVAKTLGASSWQLLRWHIVPHTFAQINARLTIDIGYAIVALTGLSFLGLGAQNPSPEWGLMIANAKTYVLNAWWYAVFPGMVIFATVLYFVWLGDELAEERG
ncbi:MAG TPA: ABC transporter permease [Gaiellaceae bacterium]|nr:ABC transporter permease [Gaiellaceae bacterium]